MKKKIGLLILPLLLLVISQLVFIPLYFNKNLAEKINRNLVFDMTTNVFNNYLRHKFNINIDSTNILSKLKVKKNVDVLIVNHFSSIDFILVFYLLNCVMRKDWILIQKKGLLYVPVLNNMLSSERYISLNRNWEKDKDLIEKAINKLESGIVLIFPEGTRFSPDNYAKSKKFCQENNLICNKKLLIPKVKGLFTIINILKKNNKLGNFYDLSSVIPEIMENFKKVKYTYPKLFTTDLSESYHYIRELKLPEYYYDYDTFKNWLYHQWNTKDLFLQNYKNYKYKRLIGKANSKNVTSCYVLIVVYMYLLKNYPIHPGSSFALSYLTSTIIACLC